MSEPTSGAVDTIDLTGSPSTKSNNTPGGTKKLKQLRLPFAPIQKKTVEVVEKTDKPEKKEPEDSQVKKRKHSEDEKAGEPNKKPALQSEDAGGAEAEAVDTIKENNADVVEVSESPEKKKVSEKKSPCKDVKKEVPEKKVKETKSKSPAPRKGSAKKQQPGSNKKCSAKSPKPNLLEKSLVPIDKFATKESSKKTSDVESTSKQVDVDEDSVEIISANSVETPKNKETEPSKKEEAETPKGDVEMEDVSTPSESGSKTPISKSKQNVIMFNTPKSCIETPKSSPAVLEEYRRRVKVEISRLTVRIHEFRDDLEKAVADQEFLRANELKEKIREAEKEKEAMQASVDSSDLETLKRFSTPKTTPINVSNVTSPSPSTAPSTPASTSAPKRKRSAVKVKTPGSVPLTPDSTPATPGQGEGSGPVKMKRLTPKQIALRAEIEKRKEEKEKQREEAKRAKETERLKKEAERKEKEAQRELEKFEKEKERKAKEEEKEKQRLEREKQKEAEKREKEERQKQREIEKEEKQRQREIEKEQKEQERKLQEELEKKKVTKVAESFKSFFVKKTADVEQEKTDENAPLNPNNLTQFRVKKDMRLAPLTRVTLSAEMSQTLDECLTTSKLDKDELYLSELKEGKRKSLKSQRTWPIEVGSGATKKGSDDEVEILEDEEDEDEEIGEEVVVTAAPIPDKLAQPKEKLKAKLLQFHDNQRPPYWGTWTKTSAVVGPRHPLGKDNHYFDYDYDSDDDWEEEEQGESLSDEEKDKEEDEEEEEEKAEENDDDGFFVGHGVLGEDELHAGDDSDEGEIDVDFEMKKQKLRAQEFEKQYKKKKMTKLKPRVYGPFWINNENDERPKIVLEQLFKILSPFRAVSLCPISGIPTTISQPNASPTGGLNGNGENGETPQASGAPGSAASRRWKTFPDESLPDLIRLVHTNTNNKMFLAKEFAEFWKKKNNSTNDAEISRTKILSKIAEISDYKKSSEHGLSLNRGCWIVKPDVLEKFSLGNLEIPNNWEYILELPTKNVGTGTPTATVNGTPTVSAGSGESNCDTPKSDRPAPSTNLLKANKVTPSSLITKFTKVLTEEERQSQLLSSKPVPVAPQPAVAGPSSSVESNNGATPAKVKKRIQPTLISMTAAMNKSQNNSPAPEKSKE